MTLKGPSPRWGGQPWRHLNSLSIHHLNSVGQRVKRLHYKRPGETTAIGTAANKERSRDQGGMHGGMGGMHGFGGMMGMHDEDDEVEDDFAQFTRAPPRKQKPKPDQEIVTMLVSMGFTENAASRCALACGNKGVAEAQEWAFQHMEDSNFNEEIKDEEDEEAAKEVKKVVEVDESVVATLVNMGFSEVGCRRACMATNNSADASMEWILEHMGDEDFNDPLPSVSEGTSDEGAAAESASEPKSDVESDVGSDVGSEVGVKRDNSGEPKVKESDSESTMTDDAAPASGEAVNNLTFDFSQFSSNTLPTPPTTSGTASPPPLDINAMIAALSASSQAATTQATPTSAPAPAPVVDKSLSVIADDACVELVLTDAVVGDEESGGNRQLGFSFLFEVLTGSVTLKLVDKDVSKSLGEIMMRYMHLKTARWGRETTDSGEVEAAPSRHFAQLAAVLNHPEVSWPCFPSDGNSSARLMHGFNLKRSAPPVNPFDPRPRPPPPKTAIHTWLERLDKVFNRVLTSQAHFVLEDRWSSEAQRLSRANLDHSEVRSVNLESDSYPPILRHYYETVMPMDAVVVDTSCASRLLSCEGDLMSLATRPLNPIGLGTMVAPRDEKEVSLTTLPFDLTRHKDAQSSVAKDLLTRLEADVKGYATMTANESLFDFIGLEDVSKLLDVNYDKTALNTAFDRLQDALASLANKDHEEACQALSSSIDLSNMVNHATDEAGAVSRLQFTLRRNARQHSHVEPNLLTRSLMSSSAHSDLRHVNPFLCDQDISLLLNRLPVTLLRFNRVAHANRARACLGRLRDLVSKLHDCLPTQPVIESAMRVDFEASVEKTEVESAVDNLRRRVEQSAKTLVTQLLSDRHYTCEEGGEVYVDPRFLVFEYAFDILLRARQVEMVRSFVATKQSGDSSQDGIVQQMIMGAGKTTVIGPLLTLLLADGKHLVTQVMPSALLDMSRNVLRKCFTCPLLPKRVYTLSFDRSVEDSAELVRALHAKLMAAERGRGVVVAAPEAIKSLMLKLVEQMHAIEEVELEALLPSNSSRHNRESVRLRDAMIRRSDMADALVPVLGLWSRAVLVMDEVDVLLHPLRSELNFPVGHKVPIDLGAQRWNLPFFLLDVIVSVDAEERSGKKTSRDRPCEASDEESDAAIGCLRDAINNGYLTHSLQRQPHLVLLDFRWYARVLRPAVASWMVLWLLRQVPISLTREDIIKYMTCSIDDLESLRSQVETMDTSSVKLLNLARSWILTLLPHVLSKIHRVSFGILRPTDLSMVDPKSPPSRKLLAVPFVGKDVPSRASEFAHPDVLIGLSILAYRYDGMRLTDVQRLSSQLKQDLSRQVGPRTMRPAAQTFDGWLDALRAHATPATVTSSSFSITMMSDDDAVPAAPKLQRTPSAVGRDAVEVLPLALFQPTDPVQLGRLHTCIGEYAPSIHYYLRQHVFPALMNFQATKISACGHELGSSILFGKRIGFSGTPSNLLPLDLGGCQYEPGSDGRVISVLTNPLVVNIEQKQNWSAKLLLMDVATAYERTGSPVHALIDTGALITGMDNLAVAVFLLTHLSPQIFDGVSLTYNFTLCFFLL